MYKLHDYKVLSEYQLIRSVSMTVDKKIPVQATLLTGCCCLSAFFNMHNFSSLYKKYPVIKHISISNKMKRHGDKSILLGWFFFVFKTYVLEKMFYFKSKISHHSYKKI